MQPILRRRKDFVIGILIVALASTCGGTRYLSASGQERPKSDEDTQLTEPSLSEVRIEDSFWKPRIEINRTLSLDHQHEECVQTGRIANFEVAAGLIQGTFQGRHYNDADVYKWIEGASYSLATHPDQKLEARLDAVISKIAAAQEKDGYLNTFIQLSYPRGRWTNLGMLHELYNSGHLFEAAVAHHQATRKKNLLVVATRLADYIDSVFGPGKRDGTSGHPEIELALVKLYRTTGEKRYRRLAEFFLNQRGQQPSYFAREYQRLDPSFTFEFKGESISHRTLNDRQFLRDPNNFDTRYCQDHLPVRQQSEVVGHAVRAMYLYSGMADVASETGDPSLLQALRGLHDNVTLKRMYVTGGLGPSKYNEGFTTDYDLPNDTAYQETCASVGMVFWNHRMLKLTGNGRYADVMEQSLYNGVLSGVSLTGDKFFYINPLYSSGVETKDLKPELNRFSIYRQAWFGTACCPTNLARLFPSLGKYIFGVAADGLWVNLYIGSNLMTRFPDGSKVNLRQTGSYPWEGNIRMEVGLEAAREFSLRLRVPAWASGAVLKLNGGQVHPTVSKGYAEIRRQWRNSDVVEIVFPMEVQRLEANPRVTQDRGRVALRRGPLIYCLEQVDQQTDVDQIVLPMTGKLETRFEAGLLNGVAVITGEGRLKDSSNWRDELYRPAPSARFASTTVKAIPYYAWANRKQGKMTVWIESAR